MKHPEHLIFPSQMAGKVGNLSTLDIRIWHNCQKKRKHSGSSKYLHYPTLALSSSIGRLLLSASLLCAPSFAHSIPNFLRFTKHAKNWQHPSPTLVPCKLSSSRPVRCAMELMPLSPMKQLIMKRPLRFFRVAKWTAPESPTVVALSSKWRRLVSWPIYLHAEFVMPVPDSLRSCKYKTILCYIPRYEFLGLSGLC